MDDTAKLVALILLASFAIERITAAIDFLLDGLELKRLDPEEAARMRAKRQRKLVLGVIGAILAFAAVALIDIRILRVLNFKAHPILDFAVSWLVLFAGADKIRDLFAGGQGGGADATEAQAFEIEIHDKADIRQVGRAS